MIGGKLKAVNLITAPGEFWYDSPNYPEGKLRIFLAGGITGCRDWQKECVEWLDEILYNNGDRGVLVFNPRREKWDMNDPSAVFQQIDWEFRKLEAMDIFSMYFCTSDTSVGPICFYELGRNICRMQMRFPSSWQKRIVISTDQGYSRTEDVHWQTKFAAEGLGVNRNVTPQSHARAIADAIKDLEYWTENFY